MFGRASPILIVMFILAFLSVIMIPVVAGGKMVSSANLLAITAGRANCAEAEKPVIKKCLATRPLPVAPAVFRHIPVLRIITKLADGNARQVSPAYHRRI